ncbi:MAG: hypothetical protein A3F53_01620 [Candidatus Zambryskibacteria bacterium RIFCSPHIGHO2_12_FULL_48_10]|nr:MAG: hypothetical protein A3F53_01620 [Candidatus Zambryskibacteria bacterium RIFCSPHIGHO2_12_FULL_48_10]
MRELVMDGKGHEEGATTLITTASVAVVVPSVQLSVSVVGVEVEGYHGWLGAMGPSLPERDTPETPEGDVSWQDVAFEEVHV